MAFGRKKTAFYSDNSYSKMARMAGRDFSKQYKANTEQYKFRCSKCGFTDILENKKEMTCSCGKHLEGKLVFKIVAGQQIINKL